MIKKIFLIVAVILLFVSCTSRNKRMNKQDKQVVTVSILPQRTFIEKIAGEDFDIQVLVPHGASPESYSLLPSQLKQISHSAVWFRLGYLGFELSWSEKIKQLNHEMKVINLSEGLDLISGEKVTHANHFHFEGIDPHIWMSPKLVKQMAGKITEVLSELNPKNADVYQTNYQYFSSEIELLDKKIREAFKEHQGQAIMTFHPSLSYFVRDYGLIQYSLESGGKEPTTQHMAKMVELARKENVDVIYIQSEFDKDHAQVFAKEIGGKVIEIWPLNPEWQENLMDITHLIIENF